MSTNTARRARRGNYAPAGSSRKSRAAAIARADRGAYSRADRARILADTSAAELDGTVLA